MRRKAPDAAQTSLNGFMHKVEQQTAVMEETDWRGEIDRADVEMCEIPESYYRDIARSSAKDSLELGM